MKVEVTIEENGHTEKTIFVKPKEIKRLRQKDTGIVGHILRGGDQGDPMHSKDCSCNACIS